MSNPLRDNWELILDSFNRWRRIVRDPSIDLVAALNAETPEAARKMIRDIWFDAFTLSFFLIMLIRIKVLGVTLENFGFSLWEVVVQYAGTILTAWLFHIVLKMFGVCSSWPDTLIIYTVTVVPITPLFSLTSGLDEARSLELLRNAAAHHLPLWAMLQADFKLMASPTALTAAAAPLTELLLVFALARFARAVASHCRMPLTRPVYAAAFTTGVLGVPPTLAFRWLELAVKYTFIGVPK